jgi:hypothetical protein
MFTICGLHGNERHEGRWQDCAQCRENGPLEMYVDWATNEYNFEKLENPPPFEPTHCGGCGVVIRLAKDSFSMREGKYFCEACNTRESRTSMQQFLAQLIPPPARDRPMEKMPVRITGRRGRYPIASLAYYGPDSTLATKLVVNIVKACPKRSRFRNLTWSGRLRGLRNARDAEGETVEVRKTGKPIRYERQFSKEEDNPSVMVGCWGPIRPPDVVVAGLASWIGVRANGR